MQPLDGGAAAPAAPAARAPDVLPVDIGAPRVLLVEDNELNQIVAVELLLDAGLWWMWRNNGRWLSSSCAKPRMTLC